MRTFKGFNPVGQPCPICDTKANAETILVPVPGTEDDGIVEARQVHKACFDLVIKMQALEDSRLTAIPEA